MNICQAIISSGPRKNLKCIYKSKFGNYCGNHKNYEEKTIKISNKTKTKTNTNTNTKSKGKNANLYGRCLEFAVAYQFNKEFEFNEKTKERFKQYKIIYWNKLNEQEKLNFLQNAKITVNNFKKYFLKNYFQENVRYICMLDDNMGAKGICADIVIKTHNGYSNFHISLKHTKDYAKSQRPSALPKQCGFNVIETNKYKTEYDNITTIFWNNNKHHNVFANVENTKEDLYQPIYELVKKYVNKLTKNNIKILFQFLHTREYSKNIKFVNILVQKKNIQLRTLNHKIQLPTRVKTFFNEKGYLVLEFNNHFKYVMRLHNDESKLTKNNKKNIKLKFDTILQNMDKIYNTKIISK